MSQLFFTALFTRNSTPAYQPHQNLHAKHLLEALQKMLSSEMSTEKKSLEAFRIAGLPPDFYYIPNFISVEEETSILQKVSPHCFPHSTDSLSHLYLIMLTTKFQIRYPQTAGHTSPTAVCKPYLQHSQNQIRSSQLRYQITSRIPLSSDSRSTASLHTRRISNLITCWSMSIGLVRASCRMRMAMRMQMWLRR